LESWGKEKEDDRTAAVGVWALNFLRVLVGFGFVTLPGGRVEFYDLLVDSPRYHHAEENTPVHKGRFFVIPSISLFPRFRPSLVHIVFLATCRRTPVCDSSSSRVHPDLALIGFFFVMPHRTWHIYDLMLHFSLVFSFCLSLGPNPASRWPSNHHHVPILCILVITISYSTLA
jgi:hypothetical protein